MLAEAGVLADYQAAARSKRTRPARRLPQGLRSGSRQSALYLLPLATRMCVALFKMDFAEAQYIIELRSGPPGTSAIAAWPGRCFSRSRGSIPRWRSTCG
jgi:hypothetical protein